MSVFENLKLIRERVEEAKARSGRTDEGPRLMAVTKTQPFAAVEQAYQAGIRLFGENRVQEAQAKFASVPEGSELHLIGHLQRNKARQVAGLFSAVQSIDSLRTARALEEALAEPVDVFLEVNTGGEQSKFGYRDTDTLLRETDEMARLKQLHLVGLMTMAPFVSDESVLRRCFAGLRETLAKLQDAFPELPLRELSMGMSNDFEIAVEEGSTLLRLGTVVFGGRTGGAA